MHTIVYVDSTCRYACGCSLSITCHVPVANKIIC